MYILSLKLIILLIKNLNTTTIHLVIQLFLKTTPQQFLIAITITPTQHT